MASPPEGCKVLALRAWLGAGVDAAELQEVFILDDVVMRQVIQDSCFIQVLAALCDGAFYIRLSQLHLRIKKKKKDLYDILLRKVKQALVNFVRKINFKYCNNPETT